MKGTLLRLLALLVLLPLAIGIPVWAQVPTETWTNFILGAPVGSPAGSDVIPCIEGSLSHNCSLASILALAPGGGGGTTTIVAASGDCQGGVVGTTLTLSCPGLLHLTTTTSQVMTAPVYYQGSAQVSAKSVTGTYSWTSTDPQIYNVDVSGGMATLTFGSSVLTLPNEYHCVKDFRRLSVTVTSTIALIAGAGTTIEGSASQVLGGTTTAAGVSRCMHYTTSTQNWDFL